MGKKWNYKQLSAAVRSFKRSYKITSSTKMLNKNPGLWSAVINYKKARGFKSFGDAIESLGVKHTARVRRKLDENLIKQRLRELTEKHNYLTSSSAIRQKDSGLEYAIYKHGKNQQIQNFGCVIKSFGIEHKTLLRAPKEWKSVQGELRIKKKVLDFERKYGKISQKKLRENNEINLLVSIYNYGRKRGISGFYNILNYLHAQTWRKKSAVAPPFLRDNDKKKYKRFTEIYFASKLEEQLLTLNNLRDKEVITDELNDYLIPIIKNKRLTGYALTEHGKKTAEGLKIVKEFKDYSSGLKQTMP